MIRAIQVVLCIIAFMMVRSGEVGKLQALALFLCGFYVQWTPFAAPILTAVEWIVSSLTHTNY